ncbi:MAG: hypothetical protein DRI56_10255 [Chloroflexota bacterium]|nr:MAG: hypothetical protein DRI56_10255 [Chloroflexota bacterium]
MNTSSNGSPKQLQWLARGLGTLTSVFWIFSLGKHTLFDPANEEELTGEGILLGFLVVICVIGVIIGWYREKTGGIVTIVGGLALCVFAYISAGRNQWFAVLVSGMPFLVAGVLFYLYGQKTVDSY